MSAIDENGKGIGYYQEQRKKAYSGKSGWTRFVGWLNNLMNPRHDWMDYENAPKAGKGLLGKIFGDNGFTDWLSDVGSAIGSVANELTDPNQLGSLVNTFTGAHLTGSQREANELQMQNVEDVYQRQVTGMQNAGLNPALMYQSGAASNAPNVQGSQGVASMSEMMQAFLLEKQSRLLDAQANKTDAETQKLGAETEQVKLVNKYYPDVTETGIKKVLSELGVNEERINEIKSQVDLNKLDADLKEIQKIINKAQSDESSRYFKATRELAEAQTEEARSRAREEVARAFMEELEGKFMDKYGAKMGSSELIALASAISSVLGVDLSLFGKSPFAGVLDMLRDWMTRSEQGKGGKTSPSSSQSGPTGNSR